MSSPTPPWPGQVQVTVLTEPAFDDRVHLLIDEHIEGAIEAGMADLALDVDTRVSEAIAAQDLLTAEEVDTQIDGKIAGLASTEDVTAQIDAVDARIDALDIPTTAEIDAQITNALDELPPPSAVNRQTATVTKTIAAGTDVEAPITLAPSYALIGLSTSVPARVRLYPTSIAASDDATRPVTEDPSSTSELVLEYVTADSSPVAISPAVTGASLASPPSPTVVARIANLTTASASVTLTLTYLALEA